MRAPATRPCTCCAPPWWRPPSVPFRPGSVFVDPPVDWRPSRPLFPDISLHRPSCLRGRRNPILATGPGLRDISMLRRIVFAFLAGALLSAPVQATTLELLNVSYDPTRELWRAVNAAFTPKYEKEAGVTLSIKQSHGDSGTQARAVVDGLEADVVTLALWP